MPLLRCRPPTNAAYPRSRLAFFLAGLEPRPRAIQPTANPKNAASNIHTMI